MLTYDTVVGAPMSKVYKSNGKFTVNIPPEVIKTLGIGEEDEVDFLQYKGKYYLFAKKSDIGSFLTGSKTYVPSQQGSSKVPEVTEDELRLLKKLDTIRYGERTRTKLKSVLSKEEKTVMHGLVSKKIVEPYSKNKDEEPKYGINKRVYDAFLYGKRERQTAQPTVQAKAAQPQQPQPQQVQRAPEQKPSWSQPKTVSSYMTQLEANGYLVLSNEAEAAQLSVELEDSIKSGAVVGTRAFNKKFYVIMRRFMSRNAMIIIKALDKKPLPVSEISKATDIDEDGIRAILYLMAEGGEVIEVRRDHFSLVV
jgi:bifunctional DNA-binding transcriptional regulator/antitoxin component of YhaV-PrlF toxin-antitoxin module